MTELEDWRTIAAALHVPYDSELGINPQDDSFLDLKPWIEETVAPNGTPLLQRFHPLVIYRHQVLKMATSSWRCGYNRKSSNSTRCNGTSTSTIQSRLADSSLSASVQAIVAAQVDRPVAAHAHFRARLYLDLLDLQYGTSAGVHVANTGGVWSALAHGVLGLHDDGDVLRVSPSLPTDWESVSMRLSVRGSLVELTHSNGGTHVELIEGGVGNDRGFEAVHQSQSVRGHKGSPCRSRG